MRKNTLSTQYTANLRQRQSSRVDFATFLDIKPWLKPKDDELSATLARYIDKSSRGRRWLRLLDVGTGDGSLILSIATSLAQRYAVDLSCLDPAPEAHAVINELAPRFRKARITLHQLIGTAEQLIDETSRLGEYSATNVCHALYYIHPRQWRETIRALRRHLDRTGVLLVTLVSKSSDIYKIILPHVEGHLPPGTYRTFAEHGYLTFAEDFELTGYDCEISTISTVMEIPFAEYPYTEDDAVVEFLAFMFRLEREHLVRVLPPIDNRFVVDDSFRFASTDYVFTLRG